MVTLGVDSHKATHTVVAVDETGCKLSQVTVRANSDGHLHALSWASEWRERRWALEDCRHVSGRLERDLLGAGETALRVPPRLTAGARGSARTTGKSDPIDALAVARAALREPNLPTAKLAGPSREIRLLVAHREDLVGERTRIQNRLRWHLHELDPGGDHEIHSLNGAKALHALEVQLLDQDGLVAAIALELVQSVRALTLRINQQRLTLLPEPPRLRPICWDCRAVGRSLGTIARPGPTSILSLAPPWAPKVDSVGRHSTPENHRAPRPATRRCPGATSGSQRVFGEAPAASQRHVFRGRS